MPPVSMTWNCRPPHSAPAWRRSRVTPGTGSMTASRRPVIRLNRVDLPDVRVPDDGDDRLVGGQRRRARGARALAGHAAWTLGVAHPRSSRRRPQRADRGHHPVRGHLAALAAGAGGQLGQVERRADADPHRPEPAVGPGDRDGHHPDVVGQAERAGTRPRRPDVPVGVARPLGKHQQRIAAVEHLARGPDRAAIRPAALDGKRAQAPDRPTDHRHPEQLALGHEVDPAPADQRVADHRRIPHGDVVGDEQRGPLGRDVLDPDHPQPERQPEQRRQDAPRHPPQRRGRCGPPTRRSRRDPLASALGPADDGRDDLLDR